MPNTWRRAAATSSSRAVSDAAGTSHKRTRVEANQVAAYVPAPSTAALSTAHGARKFSQPQAAAADNFAYLAQGARGGHD
jgi:hypothetical protein